MLHYNVWKCDNFILIDFIRIKRKMESNSSNQSSQQVREFDSSKFKGIKRRQSNPNSIDEKRYFTIHKNSLLLLNYESYILDKYKYEVLFIQIIRGIVYSYGKYLILDVFKMKNQFFI